MKQLAPATLQEPRQIDCRPAQAVERPEALALILASPGARRASDGQVVDFLAFAMQRGIDLARLWVVVSQRRLHWAALPVFSPGQTMLLLTSQQMPTSPEEDSAVGKLIEAVMESTAADGTHLAQVLLDPKATALSSLLQRHQFVSLAELIYLDKSVSRAPSPPPWPAEMELQLYSPANHAAFARTIAASYAGSLDCPEMNGLRDLEDVLAGHRAAGEFDPDLWFLLNEDSKPLAVLLLSRSLRSDGLELVYLGLIPEARGRGIGSLLLRHAFSCVAPAGCARLTLAVDARNAPALRLYYRHGMRRLASRQALLRDLRRTTGASRSAHAHAISGTPEMRDR